MPCFKGLAVSIHTPSGPLPEHNIRRQGRHHMVTSYIPVPQPEVNLETGLAEPSTFAISITLLNLGQVIPYSRHNPPFGAPHLGYPRVHPGGYEAYSASQNETVAAYIHFDGRQKEEVATLLRRGEETWVDSRWVSVPPSEGGGLAERQFLFREVGLERWLNGLDLKGEQKDISARIEKRKRRLEKKRRKRVEAKDSTEEEDGNVLTRGKNERDGDGVLRYGSGKDSPMEKVSNDDTMGSDTDSEDDEPIPETAGQIKVSLFRVLASGEVKRGEFAPQFDAHDDDDMTHDGGGGGDREADVDHTTTFAKPKALDPKSISTQTVTGLDDPQHPYAQFVFFYRGRKQLEKMGIIPTAPSSTPSPTTQRKTKQLDFSSMKPLQNQGTVGFASYRDTAQASKKGKRNIDDEMDSDADDEDDALGKKLSKSNGMPKGEDDDRDEVVGRDLSAEEAAKRGELSEGVKKMHLKRQRSLDRSSPERPNQSTTSNSANHTNNIDANHTTPTSSSGANKAPSALNPSLSGAAGANPSPFKKQRGSVSSAGGPSNLSVAPPSSIPSGVTEGSTAGGPFHAPKNGEMGHPSDVSKHATISENVGMETTSKHAAGGSVQEPTSHEAEAIKVGAIPHEPSNPTGPDPSTASATMEGGATSAVSAPEPVKDIDGDEEL